MSRSTKFLSLKTNFHGNGMDATGFPWNCRGHAAMCPQAEQSMNEVKKDFRFILQVCFVRGILPFLMQVYYALNTILD